MKGGMMNLKASLNSTKRVNSVPYQKRVSEAEEFESLLRDFIAEWRKKRRGKSEQDVLMFFLDYFCVRREIPFRKLLEQMERALLVRILSEMNGNQKETAEILSIKYTTLNEKIKRYRINYRKLYM